jgi:glycosyltransferase involved in cell wall biosynthesis
LKILFATSTPYLPSVGGAWKAIRAAAEQLAARGHEVHVLALARTRLDRSATIEELLALLDRSQIAFERNAATCRFHLGGVTVAAADGVFALHALMKRACREQAPDAIVVSSEDLRQILLSLAIEHAAERTVYYALTTTMLPFGPHASSPNRFGKALIEQSRAVIAASRYLAAYITEHSGRAGVEVVYPPCLATSSAVPELGGFDRGLVAIINPSAFKGITIFAGLARAFPELAFGAVPTWATSAADRAALEALPNVKLIAANENVDEIYRQVRVLLVPSLWSEVFGQVIPEALERGIPVLASDSGGIPEALLGVSAPIPVRPIVEYAIDPATATPMALSVPEQDLAPWQAALTPLITDRAAYERVATAGRAAARRFIAEEVHIEQLERVLVAVARGR